MAFQQLPTSIPHAFHEPNDNKKQPKWHQNGTKNHLNRENGPGGGSWRPQGMQRSKKHATTTPERVQKGAKRYPFGSLRLLFSIKIGLRNRIEFLTRCSCISGAIWRGRPSIRSRLRSRNACQHFSGKAEKVTKHVHILEPFGSLLGAIGQYFRFVFCRPFPSSFLTTFRQGFGSK